MPGIFCRLPQLLGGSAKLLGDRAILLGGNAPLLGELALVLRGRLILRRSFTPHLTRDSPSLGGFATVLGLATVPFGRRSLSSVQRRSFSAHGNRIREVG